MRKTDLPLLFIVSGGVLQIPAVFQAKELGLLTAVSDRDPNAPAMKYADIPVILDTWNVNGHIKKAKELSKKYKLVGIYTQGADVEVTVAKTAAALKLPGTNPKAALRCKNKALMRKVLMKTKLNIVPFAEVKKAKETFNAVKKIGFPVIFKNVDNSASRGTTVVSKENQIKKALQKAKQASKTNTALIEKFMVGSEHSVDMLVFNGKYYPAGICDRPFSRAPLRIELGHIVPTKLSKKKQDAIYKLTEKSSRALGIDFGVAKADILMTKQGPVILEMTNRLSGGFDAQYTKPYATGMNLIRATIKMAIGTGVDSFDIKTKYNYVSACFALFPKPGQIKKIQGIEDALQIPHITNVIMTRRVGQRIDSYENSADRAGFVIAVAKSRNLAINSVKNAIKKIKIKTI